MDVADSGTAKMSLGGAPGTCEIKMRLINIALNHKSNAGHLDVYLGASQQRKSWTKLRGALLETTFKITLVFEITWGGRPVWSSSVRHYIRSKDAKDLRSKHKQNDIKLLGENSIIF